MTNPSPLTPKVPRKSQDIKARRSRAARRKDGREAQAFGAALNALVAAPGAAASKASPSTKPAAEAIAPGTVTKTSVAKTAIGTPNGPVTPAAVETIAAAAKAAAGTTTAPAAKATAGTTTVPAASAAAGTVPSPAASDAGAPGKEKTSPKRRTAQNPAPPSAARSRSRALPHGDEKAGAAEISIAPENAKAPTGTSTVRRSGGAPPSTEGRIAAAAETGKAGTTENASTPPPSPGAAIPPEGMKATSTGQAQGKTVAVRDAPAPPPPAGMPPSHARGRQRAADRPNAPEAPRGSVSPGETEGGKFAEKAKSPVTTVSPGASASPGTDAVPTPKGGNDTARIGTAPSDAAAKSSPLPAGEAVPESPKKDRAPALPGPPTAGTAAAKPVAPVGPAFTGGSGGPPSRDKQKNAPGADGASAASGSPAGTARTEPFRPAAEAANPPPAGPPLVEQVAVRISPLAEGLHEVEIRLEPDHLGKLTIDLRIQGGRVDALLQADNAEARAVLLREESSLRDALSSSGITLSSYTVSLAGNGAKEERRAFRAGTGEGDRTARRRTAESAALSGPDEPHPAGTGSATHWIA